MTSTISGIITRYIQHRIAQLADFPNSGSTPPSEWLAEHGYKMIISGNYAAIYHLYGTEVYQYSARLSKVI